MKKLSQKQKRWLISRSAKRMRCLKRLNREKPDRQAAESVNTSNGTKRSGELGHMLTAPVNFSLIENCEETLWFFKHVLDVVEKCSKMDKLYFDLSNIEYISTDAIMYITALIKNVKRIRAFHIQCAGNLPRNKEARELIERSGFYNFVSALNRNEVSTISDRIQISSGKDANGELTGEICEFVHRVSGKGRIETKRLFSTIMELMTNTRQHAYMDDGSVMAGKWYIFAEGVEDAVRFVFLDTGLGIPSTVNKKFTERIMELTRILGIGFDDAKYISSALRGELRSETRQENRGKGLPGIFEDSCDGLITGLVIISGRGRCKIMPDCSIAESELQTNFAGTLFIWDFHA